jgi:hypothetical protein
MSGKMACEVSARVLAQSRDFVGLMWVRVTAYLAYVAGSVGADTFARLCCRSLAQRAGYVGPWYRHWDECVALVSGLVNRADESSGVVDWGYLGGMAGWRIGLTPQIQFPDNHHGTVEDPVDLL